MVVDVLLAHLAYRVVLEALAPELAQAVVLDFLHLPALFVISRHVVEHRLVGADIQVPLLQNHILPGALLRVQRGFHGWAGRLGRGLDRGFLR